MANDNQVTVVGNLTDDPELRYTPNGAAVCKFRIAVNRRMPDGAGGWKDGEASYFSVNCWRSLAENVAETLNAAPAWLSPAVCSTEPGRARTERNGAPWRSRPTRSVRAFGGPPRRSNATPVPPALVPAATGARRWRHRSAA